MENTAVVEIIKQHRGVSKFKIQEPTGSTIKRLFVSGDSVAEFRKGSSRRGYQVNVAAWISITPAEGSLKEQWERSWKRVEKNLAASGLNPDVLADVRLALAIGYDKIQEARNSKWDQSLSYDENQRREVEHIVAVDPRLGKDKVGFNSTILWHMAAPAKVKAVYFGDNHEAKKRAVEQGIREGKDVKEYGRASYDVSFYFEAGSKRATYSEEYRNCGNGHYYLAISPSQAVFWEDD